MNTFNRFGSHIQWRLIIKPSKKHVLTHYMAFILKGLRMRFVCLRACVSDLTLLCSPLQYHRGPGCLLAASSPGQTAAAREEIRFRRAASPGPLEAASGAFSKRLPPLLLIRSGKNPIKRGVAAESRAACMNCEYTLQSEVATEGLERALVERVNSVRW